MSMWQDRASSWIVAAVFVVVFLSAWLLMGVGIYHLAGGC